MPVLPATGEAPRRGNWFTRWGGRTVLRLLGWRVVGWRPDLPKFVAIGAPHTSNWDGVIAFALLHALGLRVHVMAKDSLFRPPLGPLMRWLGAIAIDRSAPNGVVGQMVTEFASVDRMAVVLAPEGTRRKVEKWRSGFYRIAHAAGVPIILGYVNYPARVVGLSEPFWPTGDYEADLATIQAFYAEHAEGRHPERV